ncbi:Eco57I restriction-modification methylase domain-containing protein [Tessaracoccus sp. MC1679]|uniref:Eco57I restriction-modification methylase domain-containing protein n=1 Tax=Tessaracoccus sp. MC1679 TaxID=2760313 RepID=UPI0015FEFE3D|nr:Eco57I restriction-modification methylase domain-containing protein [Tessaracoccus sp. MC1679]MBB1517400.1 Eco57I restriction-modification methylase domain-containing protein [Tessaracoccus sp. MC1679]
MTTTQFGQHVPDILDCLAQLSNDEVPTPPTLARAMLDLLPEEVWSRPDYVWLDPVSKSGVFLREVAKRLFDGLADWEPEFVTRREHIFRNMLFGASITEMTGIISRRSVYCAADASGTHSVVRFDDPLGNLPFISAAHGFDTGGKCKVCRASEDLERGEDRENYAYSFIHGAYPTKEMANMKFDVIVGNPPYQIGTEGFGATASTIYHHFVEKAIELDPRYIVMITPSRWFAGGKGLDGFRSRMIADRRIREIVDNPKIYDCFPGVKIRGGVSYFLWDRSYDGDCKFSTRIDGCIRSTMVRDLRAGDGVVIRNNRAASIVDKAVGHAGQFVESVCSVTKPFGLTMRSNYPGSVAEPFDGSIPLIYNTKVGYSRPDQIQRNHGWVHRWKVLLPMVSSGDTPVDDEGNIVDVVLGEPIALAPGSACTQTYFIAGMFESREETVNYANFLATKFVRFLVLQRKLTQHVTPDRFRFVPMMDMTRAWTDADLYDHFGLSEEERAHIEATIKPRSVNLSLDSPIPVSHLPGGAKYRPGAVPDDPEDEE